MLTGNPAATNEWMAAFISIIKVVGEASIYFLLAINTYFHHFLAKRRYLRLVFLNLTFSKRCKETHKETLYLILTTSQSIVSLVSSFFENVCLVFFLLISSFHLYCIAFLYSLLDSNM